MVYKAKGNIPNTPLSASVISAALGALLGAGLFAAAAPVWRLTGLSEAGWARPQLGVYLAAMGLFHLLEFWTTAGWNYHKLSVDAFLLNNGAHYHFAHATGLIEYMLSSYFWPGKFRSYFASLPLLCIFAGVMLLGQTFRALAMVQAGHSFSHVVKRVKLNDHVLITHGVYAYVRHPSYVGFFYWAVGTQLLLSNVFSTLAFVVVLGQFFGSRIKDEEVWLRNFFGEAYTAYAKKVGSGLPWLMK
ncbi:protein-S-isoprenylcysteine O-methyltransferase [Cutaneotrichosporon oleaginosum]|uniref:Protein-S-isoprenylcysteine O-methyltransferase n=1 Tax=Cutaneotrichosporon oleaginosum TaxID=879819 RepID=A0A0J1B0J9_9TREE|nr:protein-S-isoprenylcysteine O-methyltransferase [Cutaneotrichosporon oleaginosum]KLT41134.1 protein-S-isoprenylcysteine O-methyltransferase [Cutaneotrichosporon oleaginosum]TXT05735.1 hypothetical protein COLE_07055 [Cutaneotrichosporon oleaginosum]